MYNGLPWPEEEFIKVEVLSIFQPGKIREKYNRSQSNETCPSAACFPPTQLFGHCFPYWQGCIIQDRYSAHYTIMPFAELGPPSATAQCW